MPGRPRRVFATSGARPDAVSVLTVYLVLLVAVPSDLSLSALGSAGSPAYIWALGAGIWWCWERISQVTPVGPTAARPIHVAAFFFLLSTLASYVAAGSRPLPIDETSIANSTLIKVAAWLGIMLLAADGIPDRDRFLTLVRRIVLAGGLFAALGLVQFFTGQSIVDGLSLPGFSSGQAFSNVLDRGGFTRSAGTAMHPLEYGVVLCGVLPLAMVLSFQDRALSPLRAWIPTVAIALAAAVSVSRSALLGVLAGLIVMFPSWPNRVRLAVGGGAVAIGLALYLLVPGMVSTLADLFSGIGSDDSTASRQQSSQLAEVFVSRSPLFGRGMGTFLPQYVIFDNQYLLSLVETGVVGITALLGVVLAAIWCARSGRTLSDDPLTRQLGQALVASIVSVAVLLAFFDGFSFPKAGGLLFLLTGLCGALPRVVGSTPRGWTGSTIESARFF